VRNILAILLSLALVSAPTAALADTPVVPITPVTLAGSFGAGATLSAIYPQDDQTVSSSFEWFADGAKIDSAESSTLLLGNDLIGKRISAKVTLSKTGFANVVVDVVGARVFATLPTSSGGSMTWFDESVNTPGCFSPRASGVSTPTIGWQVWFSCNPYNTDFGTPIEQKFSWYRNGQQIDGANQSLYRLQSIDAGNSIWGVYQATFANGFVFAEAKKLRTAIPFQLQLAKPVIVGSLSLGSNLVASTTGSDPLASLSYQWFSDYAPVAGATSSNFTVRNADLGKAVQVLVIGQRDGHTSVSNLSDPVIGSNFQPVNAMDPYSKVFNGYQSTSTAYDISYLVSPNVSPAALAREKALVQKAADFWNSEYTPNGVTVLYVTKDDATWAEGFLSSRPSWSSRIPGGIRSWIESNSCGFALAFIADSKQVFIQCVRNGSESTLNDQQVGPHEYSHWVQYEQNSDLSLGTVPWLIEGQANFYGLALGIAPQDSMLKFVNKSIAGHATQYDIYNGYRFGEFKMLDLLQSGNSFDIQHMLTRGGTVWDKYAVGTLVSEWLVSKYGHQKYVDWMKELLRTKGLNNDAERAANATAFRDVFGFEYSQLGLHVAAYFAGRSQQLREAWSQNIEGQSGGASPAFFSAPGGFPMPIKPPAPSSTNINSAQVPAFSGKSTALTGSQRAFIFTKIQSGQIQQVTCTALYSANTSSRDLVIFKLRAKNTCAYAKTTLTELGRSGNIVVNVMKTKTTKKIGKVSLDVK
jgi:hypothetical protein